MRSLDDMLRSAESKSEWACRPCPHCPQRFLTDAALRSHRDRHHPGAKVVDVEEVSA